MSLPKPAPREINPVVPIGGYSSTAQSGVIPIRRTPPLALSAVPATPASPARPRARSVPVAHRPWRILLVPPTPGAPTRAFDLARWQARVMLSGLAVLLLLAAGAVTAVVVALETPDAFTSRAEVATLRERLASVEDSLAIAHVVLAESADVTADSSATAATPPKDARSAPVAEKKASPFNRARARVPAVSRATSPSIMTLGAEGLPVIGAVVSEFTTARRHPILHIIRPHLGIDISAVRGTRVAAPADGRVTRVGRQFAFGLVVEIEHADGVTTRYAHLRSALVKQGQRIVRGAVIATVGSSGLTTGPHLHYEIAINGKQVDPLKFRIAQRSTSAMPGDMPTTREDVPAPDSAGSH
ncbi:MAG: M23 family metallopeptidase [bacterium]